MRLVLTRPTRDRRTVAVIPVMALAGAAWAGEEGGAMLVESIALDVVGVRPLRPVDGAVAGCHNDGNECFVTPEETTMPKIEQVLKSEIIRLAKKQIRTVCGPLAQDVRELTRRVSQLRKTVVALDKIRATLEAKTAAEGTKLEAPEEKVKAARLSPLLIKKLRTRLGISQGQLARLVGVSGPAVAHWELGRSRPQGSNKAALVALRGVGRREVKRMLAGKK